MAGLEGQGFDHAFEVAGTIEDAGPVSFEVDGAYVLVFGEGVDLALPVDVAVADGGPDGLVAFKRAVLRVHEGDAGGVEHLVAGGEGLFAGDVGAGGIPDDLQVAVIDGGENSAEFVGR